MLISYVIALIVDTSRTIPEKYEDQLNEALITKDRNKIHEA